MTRLQSGLPGEGTGTAVVLMEAEASVPREISRADKVFILTTLLAGFLRILDDPAKSKILPTGDFRLGEAGGALFSGVDGV
jgi:hypothetical protein